MTSPTGLLAACWRDSGIQPGDVVLIHSSLRRTLSHWRLSPIEAVEAMLEAVGDEGTAVFPLFNFDFAKGAAFDVRTTPSQMGAFTEAARTHPRAHRSRHPIYSFAAIGPQAADFAVDNFSGYGADSPFGVLRALDGKVAVLDLDDQNSMTFYHHVEEMHEVDYRYHKRFTGSYTDASGTKAERTYGLFVRDVERGVLTDVNPMGELLWSRGLYCGHRPGEGTGLRVIGARALFETVSEVITAGRARGLLYSLASQ